MKRTVIRLVLAGLSLAVGSGPVAAQDLQQKVAAAKQAAAQNQQALRSYTWIEKTEIAFKGEVKNTRVESCRYGPDGKVQKTQLSEPPPPAEHKRGIRGHVVEKKTGEMKDEMQAAGALVHEYVPPSPDRIQAALAAGKITITPGAATALRIADYVKPGDALTMTLAQGGMQHVAVSSYLDTPQKAVSLDVQMQSLPDGTSYAGAITLAVPSDNIEVRITNSSYQKLAQ